jgi:multisubunit Na+/H+ antiporter MnhE subunit
MSPGRDGQLRAWVVWWILLTGLYLAFADSRRVEELVAAAVVGALGATAAALVRRERDVLLRPRPADIVAELRPVLSWPRDLALLTRALVRRPAGRVVETPFRGDDRLRTLAIAGRSIAPNTIVIDVDEERGVLLSHQLEDER